MNKGVVVNRKIYSDNKKFFMLSLENIEIGTEELEKALTEIVLNEDVLFYLLQEKDKTKDNYKRILLSFFSSHEFKSDEEIYDFINANMSKRKAFYSFLGEMLQAILLRDVCKYNLITNVISYDFNPGLTHQGPDSCLYSESDKKVVLGEAKFIESFDECINHIINDFTKSTSLLGKLQSLLIAAQVNPDANKILMSRLDDEKIKFVSLEEFLKNDLVFCGFAVHDVLVHKERYYLTEFYDRFNMETNDIKRNVEKIYNSEYVKPLSEVGTFKIIIFHLPIKSKRELIFKVIKEAQKIYLSI